MGEGEKGERKSLYRNAIQKFTAIKTSEPMPRYGPSREPDQLTFPSSKIKHKKLS